MPGKHSDRAVVTLLESLKDGVDDPNYGRLGLPLNILEAKAEDLSRGNLHNGIVALTLAKEAPGGEENACTCSGPARLSSDGNAMEVRMAFPLEWADLYQTWNMAFFTNFGSWPYYLVKLLIPSGSDYQDSPEGYLYARIIALYSHINWGMMDYLYQGTSPHLSLNWYSGSLLRTWGKINKASAWDYQLQRAKCQ